MGQGSRPPRRSVASEQSIDNRFGEAHQTAEPVNPKLTPQVNQSPDLASAATEQDRGQRIGRRQSSGSHGL